MVKVSDTEWQREWKYNPANYLYDFFESLQIYVSTPLIPRKCGCDFGVKIVYRINGRNTVILIFRDWDEIAEWSEFNYDGVYSNHYSPFSDRKEAEIAAFEKAFELAETIF